MQLLFKMYLKLQSWLLSLMHTFLAGSKLNIALRDIGHHFDTIVPSFYSPPPSHSQTTSTPANMFTTCYSCVLHACNSSSVKSLLSAMHTSAFQTFTAIHCTQLFSLYTEALFDASLSILIHTLAMAI